MRSDPSVHSKLDRGILSMYSCATSISILSLVLLVGCQEQVAASMDLAVDEGTTLDLPGPDAPGDGTLADLLPDGPPPHCKPPRVKNLDDDGCSDCLPKEAQAALVTLWAYWRPKLTAQLKNVGKGIPQALYNAQGYTNNLLKAAAVCGDLKRLDELAGYILVAFDYLSSMGSYKTWTDSTGKQLNTLSVSQFLYLVSESIQIFTGLAKAKRTTNMKALMAKAPLVLNDHYQRWILDSPSFSTHGWGCDGGWPLLPRKALTLASWVRTTDTVGSVALNAGTVFELKLAAGKLVGRLVSDAPDASTNKPYTVYEVTSLGTINDGAWHHLALVFNAAAGKLSLHLDGQLVAQKATQGKLSATTGQMHVGGYVYAGGACCFLKGDLDDLRLYKRALGAAEVKLLSQCKTAKGCVSAGLAGHWPLDGTGKNTAGKLDLEQIQGTFISGKLGQALRFDGTKGHAKTRNWYGKQTHLSFLRGKQLGLLKDSQSDPDYCHAITDTDMWIVAGLTELLTARDREPTIVPISTAKRAQLKAYLGLAVDLLQTRLVTTQLTDLEGKPAVGAVLDRGYFDAHPNNAYAGYTGSAFPTPAQKKATQNLGWDLSHARRLVHVFGTLIRSKSITGRSFPTTTTMKRLAAQYAYASFNKNLSLPLFNNFVDGSNGWYRVDYHGVGFGYAPYDLSNSAYTGGYGFWKVYNPDVDTINRALWKLAARKDPKAVTHRGAHYGTFYMGYKHVGKMSVDLATSLSLLQFLPSLAVRP